MERAVTGPGDGWDEIDGQILDRLGAVHAAVDPPPHDLADRVRFAISLERIEVEVARLGEHRLIGSGARGLERTRTSTFEAESRTIMVTVADTADGGVRVDGWLAPPAALRVELRLAPAGANEPASSAVTLADDAGRFVFGGVRHGLAQLLVHPPEPAGAPTVVTPSLTL
jgi:hypothetical protein